MKKRILSLLIVAALAVSAFSTAYAADTEQTVTIPVTLTVTHSVRNIDVTLPAAMPVSVLDGKVLTAGNLSIRNNSDSMTVQVTGVSVKDGSYSIAPYSGFPESAANKIALRINGCETVGAVELPITASAFPEITVGASLPIRYSAKVSDSGDVSGVKAASIVFTLKAGGTE